MPTRTVLLDDPRTLVAIAWIAAAAALALALISQYGFGWIPCQLCLWQRYPYALGLAAGGAAYLLWGGPAGRALAGLTALGFGVGAGIAVMHTGVEFGWWEGVTSCSGGLDLGGSTEDVLARIREAPVVRCDARESFLLGLSMTNWNLLASAGLAAAFGRAAQVGGRAGARSPA